MRSVLNVGGNNRSIPLPEHYQGWQQVLLDIDPKGEPDIVCDARTLSDLPPASYDSVYCSHNLEHYFAHEVPLVLKGFSHVLKADGFAFIRVPDMGELMSVVAKHGLDIDDVLYHSPMGPITVKDVMYGLGSEIASSGNSFYAHKTGFTRKSLPKTLNACGFPWVFSGASNLEIFAFAFVNPPSEYARSLLNLPSAG
jgi:hypothetical protein